MSYLSLVKPTMNLILYILFFFILISEAFGLQYFGKYFSGILERLIFPEFKPIPMTLGGIGEMVGQLLLGTFLLIFVIFINDKIKKYFETPEEKELRERMERRR